MIVYVCIHNGCSTYILQSTLKVLLGTTSTLSTLLGIKYKYKYYGHIQKILKYKYTSTQEHVLKEYLSTSTNVLGPMPDFHSRIFFTSG